MSRFLKRLGSTPMVFRFTVVVKELLHAPDGDDLAVGSAVSVELKRGAKASATAAVASTKRGAVFNHSLSIMATVSDDACVPGATCPRECPHPIPPPLVPSSIS